MPRGRCKRRARLALGVGVVLVVSVACGSPDDDADDVSTTTGSSEETLDESTSEASDQETDETQNTPTTAAEGEASRSSATPIEIELLGFDIVINELWTEWVTDRTILEHHWSFDFGEDDGMWVVRASVDARSLAPNFSGGDEAFTLGPFDLSTLAVIDEDGRLVRLYPPDPNDHEMVVDEYRAFEYTGQLPAPLDLSAARLAIFNGDEDWIVAQRTEIPLDGSWAQGPSEIDLGIGDLVAVHDDGYADDGQMTILGAQIGRNAGLYVFGDYDYGNVGDFRTSHGATGNFGLFDAPDGWLWLSVQLQYDKIEVPGIDPGTYLPDLDILVDGELLPQSVDWDQPLIGRNEVGALDEVSFLIPADTKIVTFADRFNGELTSIIDVALPELPAEWSTRHVPALSSVDGRTRLYSGDSLCGEVSLAEIEAATGGRWASTGVSADPWTPQSADEGSWEVQCGVAVVVDDGAALALVSARGCGAETCDGQQVGAVSREFDGFVVDVTSDSYNPVQLSDDALRALLDLVTLNL